MLTNKMPQVGDVIKELHGHCPLLVKRAYERDEGGTGFVCIPYNPDNNPHYGKDDLYYHPFELVNGMIRSLYPYTPGTNGWGYCNSGLKGDGYMYLVIIQKALQGSLF